MRHGDLAMTSAGLARHHSAALVMVMATVLCACAAHTAAPPAQSPVVIGVSPTASPMTSPTPRPATTGATMIYAATDTRLSALDAQTGAERTTYAMVGQTADLSRLGSMLTSQTTAYAVTSTLTAVAWSVDSGAVLWERPLAGSRGRMVATDAPASAGS